MPHWWDKKYGKDKLCGVTYTRLRSGKNKNGQSYSIYLPCKHGFTRYALLSWLNMGKNTCPLCRRYFYPNIVIV